MIDTIRDMRDALDKVDDDKKTALVDSLLKLTRRMSDDLVTLADIPEQYLTQLEPVITEQIRAAEKRTEKAADDILAVAEKLMAAMPAVQGPIKNDMQNQVNALFEAVNFQDLVSQHLNEIILRMNMVSKDMQTLRDLMMNMGAGGKTGSRNREPRRADAHLLNGPTTQV